MKQLASTSNERAFWGRCLRGYPEAFGTGGLNDPTSQEVGLSGQLHFTMPIPEWHLRDVWKSTGMNIINPTSGWFEIEKFSYFQIDLSGVKISRGFFKGDCWIGGLQFFFSNEQYKIERQVGIGNIAAKDLQGLFSAFDKWLDGKWSVSGFDDAIRNL